MLLGDSEGLLCVSYISFSHLPVEDFAQISAYSVPQRSYKVLCFAWEELLFGHLHISFGPRVIIDSNSLDEELIGYIFIVNRRHSHLWSHC